MSYTPVQNRFWSDGWVRKLNALDRYLFLYLLTNGRAHLTGIYELPLDLMASESGIDEKDLKMTMLLRLEPKVYYKEGWVIILNFTKHHTSTSKDFWKGVRNEFDQIPKKIQEIAISYGYPPQTLPRPSHIIDKIQYNKYTVEKDISTENEPKEKIDSSYKEMLSWAENQRGFGFLPPLTKQFAALKRARNGGINREQLKERWKEMQNDSFWSEKGFDWTNVVASFNKKK